MHFPRDWGWCNRAGWFCPFHLPETSCGCYFCVLREDSEDSDEGERGPVIRPVPITSGKLEEFTDAQVLTECTKRFVMPMYYGLEFLKETLDDPSLTQEQRGHGSQESP